MKYPKDINNTYDISIINDTSKIIEKVIKMKKTSLTHEERGDKRKAKRKYRQTPLKEIQRLLREKSNKQIKASRRTYKEVHGGKEIMVRTEDISKDLFKSLFKSKKFDDRYKLYQEQHLSDSVIKNLFKNASKKINGEEGFPDFIYFNPNTELLIIGETKSKIKDHASSSWIYNNEISSKPNEVQKFCVDGIIHYMGFCGRFNTIGIALTGNENEFKISQFYKPKNSTEVNEFDENYFLNELEYQNIFSNIRREDIKKSLKKSSRDINELTRDHVLPSQKALLVSVLIISLFENNKIKNKLVKNLDDYREEKDSKKLQKEILSNIEYVLEQTNEFNEIKIKIIKQEAEKVINSKNFTNNLILYDLLKILKDNVIPLINVNIRNSSYDALGDFYREFLKYTSGNGKNLGVVLTPNHVTDLFCDLIPFDKKDIVLDTCCGTGSFLISAMKKLISLQENEEDIENMKKHQIVGIEYLEDLFVLVSTNMLLHGDGKAQLFQGDSIKKYKSIKNNQDKKADIGFINPPYSKETDKYKEIDFLIHLLNNVKKYAIMISPLSTFFTANNKAHNLKKKELLEQHTLEAVITMPKRLFGNDANTHTCISVWKANQPYTKESKTYFYWLDDDGFVQKKGFGRDDLYGKWGKIKDNLLKDYKNKKIIKYKSALHHVEWKNEWNVFEFIETNFEGIKKEDFEKTIKEFLISNIEKKLDKEVKNSPIEIFEYMQNNNIKHKTKKDTLKLTDRKWNFFKLHTKDKKEECEFKINKGERLKELDRISGNMPLVTANSDNNGINEYIDESFKSSKKLFENSITIDMFFNTFYHSYKYFSDDNVHTIILKNVKNNVYISIFLITLLRFNSKKYDFGRQVRLKRLEREKIKLPVDDNGKPDWKFMEDYVKSCGYSEFIEQ